LVSKGRACSHAEALPAKALTFVVIGYNLLAASQLLILIRQALILPAEPGNHLL